MSTTDTYDFDRFDLGVMGFEGLSDSNIQVIDALLHTYLRYRVASGEVISEFDPVLLVNNEVKQSWDTAGRWPATAIAILGENRISGEWCKMRRVGPITNSGWTLVGSGEVWIGAGSGEVTQTEPGTKPDSKLLGASIASDTIVVRL